MKVTKLEPISVEFFLGYRPAASFNIPDGVPIPIVECDYIEADDVTSVKFSFEDLKLHFEVGRRSITYHYHGSDGAGTTTSPWPKLLTLELVDWATVVAVDIASRQPDLDAQLETAFIPLMYGIRTSLDTEHMDEEVDYFELHTEKEVVFLPWPGTGNASHHHHHGTCRTALSVGEDSGEEREHLAWWDPEAPAGSAVTFEPGVNVEKLGVDREAAAAWFENENRNCQAMDEIRGWLRRAVLARIAVIDTGSVPTSPFRH
jgi:hypothetical protein